MVGDVKKCIDIRIDFLSQYYVVPQEMQSEVDSFMEELVVLGESCFNAAEFEGRFASAGLSDRFNAILPKCTPRPAKMTKEQKRESKMCIRDRSFKETVLMNFTYDLGLAAVIALFLLLWVRTEPKKHGESRA